MAETKRRILIDDLTPLIAHLLDHPDLPEIAGLRPLSPDGVRIQLSSTTRVQDLRAWAATLADVTWTVLDARDGVSAPGWCVQADGLAPAVRVSVWTVLPAGYADTAEAVQDRLTTAELLLVCIDETCPACGWPERWFSPDRDIFGCPECAYTSAERCA